MNENQEDQGARSRREFFGSMGRGAALLAIGGVGGALATRARGHEMVWQIDPFKCTECGRCATHCVLDLSAVKCYHDFPMCGYCKLCFGFFQTKPNALNEGAENQMCPLGAITRTHVEDVYYQYTIDEDLCNGCGKCVAGCKGYGNASLHLQVRHDRCLNCNECTIATACPAAAFIRVPADRPYIVKHDGPNAWLNREPPPADSTHGQDE
ncbi:MAG: ferredoxin [Candidatus Brocadiae bacterium]|nr:ferredoxin [Candidatus Brocadiia bacterium]